jgi:hypothetical protein
VFGLVEIVRCEKYCDPVIAECFDQIPRLPARCRVKTGGWLIEKQDIGTPDDAQRQIHTTALSSRQRADSRVDFLLKSGEFNDFV